MRRKRLAWVGGGALGAFLVIQLVPVSRTNPPDSAPIEAPPTVRRILDKSCMDCHSNRTRWPWYAYVAPASWLVARDVRQGREHLNFSEWGEVPPLQRASLYRKIGEEVRERSMPLPIYLTVHRDARLTDEEIETLAGWAGISAPGHQDDDALFD